MQAKRQYVTKFMEFTIKALPVACLWGLSDENGSIIVYKLRSK